LINTPTLLGYVREVTGSSVRVQQVDTLSSGFAIINGQTYRTGQVGSFVRIPQGYVDLFGIVSQVGATAAPEIAHAPYFQSEKWCLVQLVGESIGPTFERGISQYPTINDEVHLVVESDLYRMYGVETVGKTVIGHLASAESVDVHIDIDKLVTRHAAILGSTGSGKSTTIASLLRTISTNLESSGQPTYSSARILLLDIHGEYAKALGDVARVFRVNANQGEDELVIPFWALDWDELADFLTGGISDDKAMHFRDKIVDLKRVSLDNNPRPGASPTGLTVDTPVPFSLHKLWYDLIDQELMTLEGDNRDQPALEAAGNANNLEPPKYKPWQRGAKVIINPTAPGIRRQLEHLRSRLLDHRFDFLLHPGDWEPNLDGSVTRDLDELLSSWLGHENAITILDLSGVPSSVMIQLIGVLLRVVYDAIFWSREKSEGGVNRPLQIVMEEAHTYLGSQSDSTTNKIARRIVKEGRKYGIGALIVSQRPSEVDDTILSQCGTFVALRMSNPMDRSQVQATVPDNLAGLMEMLPVLRTGEALITGEAVNLPVRVRIPLLGEDRRPNSEDPKVSERWRSTRLIEDYKQVVAAWRAQSSRITKSGVKEEPMERQKVSSSNIASIGYDPSSQTLEVEFLNGSVYQYYNVPGGIHEAFMRAPSKGQFLASQIKDRFPYSRV
jgi:hypothetical protein